jgi:hypothetical protein
VEDAGELLGDGGKEGLGDSGHVAVGLRAHTLCLRNVCKQYRCQLPCAAEQH